MGSSGCVPSGLFSLQLAASPAAESAAAATCSASFAPGGGASLLLSPVRCSGGYTCASTDASCYADASSGIPQVELANTPGFNRPCNFRGLATPDTAAALRSALAAARASGANATVAFGHFPLSTVSDRFLVQRELSAAGTSAYLNGHLHDRLGKRLHAWHRPALAAAAAASSAGANASAGGSNGGGRKAGAGAFLELESADWKDIRRWRILAVDGAAGDTRSYPPFHPPCEFRLSRRSPATLRARIFHRIFHPAGNALSFADLSYAKGREQTKPIILITSPADARCGSPTRFS